MKHLLFSLALVVLVYACQKELSLTKPATFERGALRQFFNKNGAALQTYSAMAPGYIRITADKGTTVSFPENAFVTMNNMPVSGEVMIEVKEIYTPADMILSNTPTTSNRLPLEAGGAFFVRAMQNGQALKLAPGKFIQLGLANADSINMDGMQVFNGDTASGTVNWIPNNNPNNVVTRDSFNSVSLFADDLQWINCDKFVNEPKITYTVNPGNCPDVDSTAVFVHFTGLNSVLRLPVTGSSFSSENMIAADATIIGICQVEGILYYSMKPVTMQHGGSVTLNFTQTTEAELKQKLAVL